MSFVIDVIARVAAVSARVLSPLQAPFALCVRGWVGWQFFSSGLLKASSWENTLFLFREEYQVPVLPPMLAALSGTVGELVLPVLLAVGLASRLAALGLFGLNVMAVVSYAHVLLSPGFEAAVAQHVLWGFALLMLALYGPGRLSVDGVLRQPGMDAPRRMLAAHS